MPESADEQAGLLRRCLATAKSHKNEMPERIFGAMVCGYKSLVSKLEAESEKYRRELGIN